jgi:hypothetical protein
MNQKGNNMPWDLEIEKSSIESPEKTKHKNQVN